MGRLYFSSEEIWTTRVTTDSVEKKPEDTCPSADLQWLTLSDIAYSVVTFVQGSDTRVCTQKNPPGFFWVHPPKKTTPKNPHFYFNLILVYTLYATNNAIFYCFKTFKALSY